MVDFTSSIFGLVPNSMLVGNHFTNFSAPQRYFRIARRIAVSYEAPAERVVQILEGALVATEGGPGYPATGSRAEYLALFGPLRPRYDVLIMDNRGTGRSGAIDCKELQNAATLTATIDCPVLVAASGCLMKSTILRPKAA